MSSPLRNWSGNQLFSPATLSRPATLAALQATVAGASRCKALGSAHSFSALAQVDAHTTLIQLDALDLGTPSLVESADGSGATIELPAA